MSQSYLNNIQRGHTDLLSGIAFGWDDVLCGSIEMIMGLDTRNVHISRWYDLTTTNALSIKFYANGRIEVKFKDSAAVESCFKRLRLSEIKLRDENWWQHDMYDTP